MRELGEKYYLKDTKRDRTILVNVKKKNFVYQGGIDEGV